MMFSHVGDTDNEPVTPKSRKSASKSAGTSTSAHRFHNSINKSRTCSPGIEENSAEVAQEGEVVGNYLHDYTLDQSQISITTNALAQKLQSQQSFNIKNRRPRRSRRKFKEQGNPALANDPYNDVN